MCVCVCVCVCVSVFYNPLKNVKFIINLRAVQKQVRQDLAALSLPASVLVIKKATPPSKKNPKQTNKQTSQPSKQVNKMSSVAKKGAIRNNGVSTENIWLTKHFANYMFF